MQVELPDGRELEVLVDGPEDGLPVVLHLGTPNGAARSASLVAAASGAGLRLVTSSRPGYGKSTRHHGRSVADVAADTGAVLDHLGADAFVTVGLSGGGPHALACAALLPGRCRAAATLASLGPWDADGLDLLAGMGEENVEEFGAAAAGEGPLTAMLTAWGAEMAAVTGDQVAASLGSLVAPVDVAALTGEFADWLAACVRASVAHGPGGWVDDDLAFVRPWGIDLAAIAVPVAVWQGGEDRMVPLAHGAWLAERVPGASAHLLPEHGHLSLVAEHLPVILRDLAAAAA